MSRPDAPFHPAAWLLWLFAGMAATLGTQNPLYLTLLLLVILWVRGSLGGGQVSPLRWGWVIPPLTALLNGLGVHLGATVVLRLPERLPVVGGPITLEALAYGFVSGYGLLVLLCLFDAWSAGANFHALRRLTPGFLFQAGLVTSIALTFVPQTRGALADIRAAQAMRGHRFQGWRDLPPLLLPLLTLGLERSIQLAEAMESRGFGGAAQPAKPHRGSLRVRLALLAGLSGLVVGLAAHLFARATLVGGAAVALSLCLILAALRRMGRRAPRSRFRADPWRRRDAVLAAGSAALLVGTLLIGTIMRGAWLFYPYPRLTPPPFDPLLGALLLVLTLPVWLRPRRQTNQAPTGQTSLAALATHPHQETAHGLVRRSEETADPR